MMSLLLTRKHLRSKVAIFGSMRKNRELTLTRLKDGGFFLHPARLLVARLGVRVEAVCPEAFSSSEEEADVSLCPRVHASATANARMLIAALWSLSSTTPQLVQMWVRTLRDFLTIAPHALHSWL